MNEVIKLLKKNKTVFNMCLWINVYINYTKKYELIWAAKKKFKNSIPVEMKYVKYNSLKYLYYLSTSKV